MIWYWEVRGGRSRYDLKFLVWIDGRMVELFVELSWGFGRFGGGEARGFRFVYVKVRKSVVDYWRMDYEGEKNYGEIGRVVFKFFFLYLVAWFD